MLIYLLLIALVGVYLWIKSYFSYFEKNGFPFVPPKFPLGSINGVGFKEHFGDFLKREYDRFKHQAPAFGFYFLNRRTIVPTDPELVKDILVRNFESFHDHGITPNPKADPISDHIFFTNGQEWKDLRAKLSPTFTSGRMKMMFPIVASKADRMIEFLKPSEEIEMKDIFASYTIESIASVAFGIDTDVQGNPENDFMKVGKAVFELQGLQKIKSLIILSSDYFTKLFNLGVNKRETIDFFMGAVRDTLEHRQRNNVKRNDMFQLGMEIMKEDKDFGFDKLAANAFIFFIAGFETSSSASTFMSYELALNQDIQERLRDEIFEVLERHNGEVTYDAIMEMKYLDMVFNETLRKWPIAEKQFRICGKDFKIPNSELVIEKGTLILIPTIGLHNDERFWDEPEKFDPERFNDENKKKIVPYSYIPFSEGPRNCIGLRFGTMQTKIGIAKLLQNFRIKKCSKTPTEMKFLPSGQVQIPLDGMWLKLERI